MKKIFCWLILFICILSSISSEDITLNYLVTTKWGPENGTGGEYIEFYRNNTFRTHLLGETDGSYFTGTYLIIKNQVLLIINFYNYLENMEPKNVVLELQTNTSSIYHYKKLDCISSDLYLTYENEAYNVKFNFFDLQTPIPKNSERIFESRKYGKMKLITVYGNKKIQNIDQIKDFPSIEANYYVFMKYSSILENNIEVWTEERFLYPSPKDNIKVLGKTDFKTNYNGNENYWFLLDIRDEGLDQYLYNSTTNVRVSDKKEYISVDGFNITNSGYWVHGSFLK